MRWIRSQVLSSLMFQIVPLPVLAAGTAMQPPTPVQLAPATRHRELRPISSASEKTDNVVKFSFGQARAVIARH